MTQADHTHLSQKDRMLADSQPAEENSLHPFSPSLTDFCRLVEYCCQQVDDPQSIAAIWESQAEALRISSQDASVETIDLLLNTMLNTLQHISEAQEQKRWRNRLKAMVIRQPRQAASPPVLALQQG